MRQFRSTREIKLNEKNGHNSLFFCLSFPEVSVAFTVFAACELLIYHVLCKYCSSRAPKRGDGLKMTWGPRSEALPMANTNVSAFLKKNLLNCFVGIAIIRITLETLQHMYSMWLSRSKTFRENINT